MTDHNYRGITFNLYESYRDRSGWVYEPTPKHIKNLLDMARAIQNSPPPRFDMGDYGTIESDDALPEDFYFPVDEVVDPFRFKKLGALDRDVAHSCGTVACAIGTAAFHGVGEIKEVMSWGEYSLVNFGLYENAELWEYIFGMAWQGVDNTPEGAVARILKLVTEGGEAVVESIKQASPQSFGVHGAVYYSRMDGTVNEIVASYKDYLGVKVGED